MRDESRVFIGNYPMPTGECFPVYIERGKGFFQNRIYRFHGYRLVGTVNTINAKNFDFDAFCYESAETLRNYDHRFNPANPLKKV